MRNKYRFTHVCFIISDICCVIFILFWGTKTMLQKEEMKALSHFGNNNYLNSISDLQDAVDRLEYYNLAIDELESICEEIQSKCDVKAYIETVDLKMDKRAYIDKLFSITKDEPQVKNDRIQIIYGEEKEQPIGILIQNQLSDIGVDGIKLGMNVKKIMDLFPDAVEESKLYDGKTVKYVLLKDESYKYYYIETGGNGETTKLYIEKR